MDPKSLKKTKDFEWLILGRARTHPKSNSSSVTFDTPTGWWFQYPSENISQNGNLPQIRVKIKNIWNHHLVKYTPTFPTTSFSWNFESNSTSAHVETWCFSHGSWHILRQLTVNTWPGASCLLMCNGEMRTFHRYIHDISQYSKTEWLSIVYSQKFSIPYIISFLLTSLYFKNSLFQNSPGVFKLFRNLK